MNYNEIINLLLSNNDENLVDKMKLFDFHIKEPYEKTAFHLYAKDFEPLNKKEPKPKF